MTLHRSTLTRGAAMAVSTAVSTAVTATLVVGAPGLAAADDARSDRRIVSYTVHRGDTATGLAVRFHAWTAELISLNHLGPEAELQVGQHLRIPVVRSAARRHQPDRTRPRRGHAAPAYDSGRDRVHRTIVRTARRHGVDPQLASAVSWQEAGWQMHHVSSAGAVGAMQVIPNTGAWMSLYAGRRLHLHRLRDNVAAGVLLLRVLRDMTSGRNNQIAAYYQGVGSIREDGWYDDTHRYVANVKAIKHRLERGLPPA